MSSFRTSAGIPYGKASFSMSHLIFVIPLLMPLAGCSNDGAGGPVISSLSTPTDAAAGSDSDQAHHSGTTDADSRATDADGEEDPTITMTPTPAGVIAHVTWVHPPGMSVAGYDIYYRKQPAAEPSSAESGPEESASEKSASEKPASEELASGEFDAEEQNSCSSGESQTVEAPAATIAGLEPNTRYSFAIRAFNESESLCSNEITATTPSTQS